MNWKEIRTKYKKAYVKWFNFTQIDLAEKVLQSNNIIYYSGLLYSFFDQNGIYVYCPPNQDEGTLDWENRIVQVNDYQEDYFFKTRTKAEAAAFEKAFEILENKLVEPK